MRKTHLKRQLENESGFTLLELLISLALIALIVVFLSSGFQFGRRIWELNTDLQVEASATITQKFLQRTLSRARPIFISKGGRDKNIVFTGTKNSLRFIANRSGKTTIGGLHQIEIYTLKSESNNNSKLLAVFFRQSLFREKPSAQAALLAKAKQRKIIDDFTTLTFRYYGKSEQGNTKQWQDTWQNRTILPEIVSVKIDYPSDDARQWPAMLIALKFATK